MNIGWQHPTTERYKHCPLQPTQNGAVTSDTNPDRYKRPPRQKKTSRDLDFNVFLDFCWFKCLLFPFKKYMDTSK